MKDFFKSFGFKVLAAIALVLVGVMIYAASTGGMATIPSMISGAILTPLQSAASAVSDGLNSFAGMFGSSTELQKQIDELQAELNDYRNKQVELDALREQNEWLKEYLNIIEQDNDYQFADPRVIAIDPADKYNNFTISAGTLSGISVNDPVITPEGLVGVVYETGLNYSKVRSILDPETQVSATVSRTRNNGVTGGTLSLAQEGKLKLGFLSRDGGAEAGDMVITSGMGGIYPAGLLIGEIEEVLPESDGMTLYGVVKPYADLSRLSQVLVITEFSGQGEAVE